MANNKRMALTGIRVVEMTEQGVGPGAGKVLADFGAESIRIEAPDRPDGMRGAIPERWDKSVGFGEFNRNKKGISINLKLPENQAIAHKLISISDLVFENFSPGVMERLGMDYSTLSQINPTLVMVSLSGMGHSGPFGKFAIYGPNLMTWSGLTHLWNHPEIPYPVGSQTYHPDFFAAIFGAYLAMGGLYRRMATGKGCYIEGPEGEMGAALLGAFYMQWLINKKEPQPIGNSSHYMAPHGIYRCEGEDSWVAIAVRDDRDWKALSRALGNPCWTQESAFTTVLGRLKHRKEIDGQVEAWTISRSGKEVVVTLQACGVPSGEVMGPKELLEDEHTNARGFWTKVEHPMMKPVRYEGQPIGLSRTPWKLRTPPFMVGQHNREVIDELLGIAEYPGQPR